MLSFILILAVPLLALVIYFYSYQRCLSARCSSSHRPFPDIAPFHILPFPRFLCRSRASSAAEGNGRCPLWVWRNRESSGKRGTAGLKQTSSAGSPSAAALLERRVASPRCNTVVHPHCHIYMYIHARAYIYTHLYYVIPARCTPDSTLHVLVQRCTRPRCYLSCAESRARQREQRRAERLKIFSRSTVSARGERKSGYLSARYLVHLRGAHPPPVFRNRPRAALAVSPSFSPSFLAPLFRYYLRYFASAIRNVPTLIPVADPPEFRSSLANVPPWQR